MTEPSRNCQLCGSYEQTRYGVCFSCARKSRTNGVIAWSIVNPLFRWNVENEIRGVHYNRKDGRSWGKPQGMEA